MRAIKDGIYKFSSFCQRSICGAKNFFRADIYLIWQYYFLATVEDEYKQKTGCGLVVNTSFNVRGEPIICTPEDAYRCFMRTEMDYLVTGNYIFDKKDQPQLSETDDWKTKFKLD